MRRHCSEAVDSRNHTCLVGPKRVRFRMPKTLSVPTPVPLALTIPLHEAGGRQGLVDKDVNFLDLNESSLNPSSIELRGPPWEPVCLPHSSWDHHLNKLFVLELLCQGLLWGKPSLRYDMKWICKQEGRRELTGLASH